MLLTTKLKLILNLFKIRHLEPIASPTESTQQNPLHIQRSSYSRRLTEQTQKPCLELQQGLSEVFSLEQTQAKAENKRLKLQPQKRIEAANHISRKQN